MNDRIIAQNRRKIVPDCKIPDFYNLDSLLSEDERQVRDTVGRFVDERVLPIIADCFEHERFPSELVPEMAELGVFGATLNDYGCAGLNKVCYGLIMQELERGGDWVLSGSKMWITDAGIGLGDHTTARNRCFIRF
jgi:alkylation response protein AidB-like acyl-CoA dehydrogenase